MKIFIDSNVFVECAKANPKAVQLVKNFFEKDLYINDVVYSEATDSKNSSGVITLIPFSFNHS